MRAPCPIVIWRAVDTSPRSQRPERRLGPRRGYRAACRSASSATTGGRCSVGEGCGRRLWPANSESRNHPGGPRRGDPMNGCCRRGAGLEGEGQHRVACIRPDRGTVIRRSLPRPGRQGRHGRAGEAGTRMRIRCRVRMGSPLRFGPIHARRFAAAVRRLGDHAPSGPTPAGKGRGPGERHAVPPVMLVPSAFPRPMGISRFRNRFRNTRPRPPGELAARPAAVRPARRGPAGNAGNIRHMRVFAAGDVATILLPNRVAQTGIKRHGNRR
jgi:hypothetical protein